MSRHAGHDAENRAVFLLSGAALIWCLLFIGAPILMNGGARERMAGTVLKLFFRPVCHQIPERCLEIGGREMAVCGRCAGIYLGFAAGLALYAVLRKFLAGYGTRILAAAALVPACLEAMLDKLPGMDPGNWVRWGTGLWLGCLMAWVLMPAVLDALQDFKKREAAV